MIWLFLFAINKDEEKGLLGNAITLLIGLMLLMTLLGLVFMTPILKAFGASEATMPYACFLL